MTTRRVGDEMPDGSIYAGISPDTHKAMYVTRGDAPLTLTFNKAKEYANGLDAYGHRDWRLPSDAEISVLFNNRAAIGGFKLAGPGTAAWYWFDGDGWDALRFTDGNHDSPAVADGRASVRCIRYDK